MTKKILPTMIGVALAGGMTAASADVSVFGHLDAAISNIDNGGTGLGSDDTNFVCTTCSIGFKGSEDLGNGLKAIFKLDFQFDAMNRNPHKGDTTVTYQYVTPGSTVTTSYTRTGVVVTESITDRDQWVGLAGGFGKVRVGTISTGYKSHGAAIDPLYRTALQGRSHGLQTRLHRGAGEEGEGRATNTVRWDSADFNGVNLVAHYTLDSDETDGEDNNPYGLGASYSNGGILAFVDYITNDGDHISTEVEAWKIGGKYSMNNFAVMGQYEDLDDTGGREVSQWHLGGTYTMGNNMVYAAYGNAETENNVGLTLSDVDAFTLAVMHSMSKRTKVYAGYNNQDNDVLGGTDRDEFSLGLKHKF